jgi:hypothetical protein
MENKGCPSFFSALTSNNVLFSPCSFVSFALFVVSCFPLPDCQAADRILLRDLTILNDVHIVSFDLDGLVLREERKTGGKIVTWDEIESWRLESLPPEQQAAAGKILSEVGLPLYQIQHRLKIGDYATLLEPAESVYPQYQARRSRTALHVAQALVWGRLTAHRREEAVEPWLHAYELYRARVIKLNEIPGERRPRIDAATALCWDLEPVWFDAAAAAKALPAVAARLKTMEQPLPEGALLYAASLALAAGEIEQGEKLLARGEWHQAQAQAGKQILELQAAVLRKKTSTALPSLRTALPKLSPEWQPTALYWIGQAEFLAPTAAEREAAWLTWLQIPALHAERSPTLSAAVLDELQTASAKDRALQLRLQREIVQKFPGSVVAEKLLRAVPLRESPR